MAAGPHPCIHAIVSVRPHRQGMLGSTGWRSPAASGTCAASKAPSGATPATEQLAVQWMGPSSEVGEFFRVGNNANRLNPPALLCFNSQDRECLAANVEDKSRLTVDFLQLGASARWP
jgi:hypothetical protein